MTTTLQPTVENILTVYRSASAGQVKDGMNWYSEAHSLALVLDPTNPLRAAGIIAAFSPRVPWRRNVALAVQTYADGVAAPKCLGRSVAKAQAILDGKDVVDTLKGPKTVAFALTIADPTDPMAVVVDRHAMSVAIGRSATDEDQKGLKRTYELFAACYREAARRAGIAPSQMQAITWVVWRETSIRTAAAARREAGRG